jgi:hypothetical protein
MADVLGKYSDAGVHGRTDNGDDPNDSLISP